jgi:hypothetical protein
MFSLLLCSENIELDYQKCCCCLEITKTKTKCNHNLCIECWGKLPDILNSDEDDSYKKCPICRKNCCTGEEE